jgi:hypothetical protein
MKPLAREHDGWLYKSSLDFPISMTLPCWVKRPASDSLLPRTTTLILMLHLLFAWVEVPPPALASPNPRSIFTSNEITPNRQTKIFLCVGLSLVNAGPRLYF